MLASKYNLFQKISLKLEKLYTFLQRETKLILIIRQVALKSF